MDLYCSWTSRSHTLMLMKEIWGPDTQYCFFFKWSFGLQQKSHEGSSLSISGYVQIHAKIVPVVCIKNGCWKLKCSTPASPVTSKHVNPSPHIIDGFLLPQPFGEMSAPEAPEQILLWSRCKNQMALSLLPPENLLICGSWERLHRKVEISSLPFLLFPIPLSRTHRRVLVLKMGK